MTTFCTYKPESCKMVQKDKNGRILDWLVTVVVGAATLGAILGSTARSSTSINPEGMNDDQLYCIANDWRSRDWKAKKFRTMNHCRFSQVTLDTLQAIHISET